MSVLTVLEFPDKRLRNKAKKVAVFDKTVVKLVDDMIETMYEYKGVGLAATQVDVHQRVIVIDVSENKDTPLCLINPKIVKKEGIEESEEGCLSVPGFFENVKRAEWVVVKAFDKEGQVYEIKADKLLSVCIQHEMDHLLGKLFVDYLSPLKQQRLRKKLEKMAKQNA